MTRLIRTESNRDFKSDYAFLLEIPLEALQTAVQEAEKRDGPVARSFSLLMDNEGNTEWYVSGFTSAEVMALVRTIDGAGGRRV